MTAFHTVRAHDQLLFGIDIERRYIIATKLRYVFSTFWLIARIQLKAKPAESVVGRTGLAVSSNPTERAPPTKGRGVAI